MLRPKIKISGLDPIYEDMTAVDIKDKLYSLLLSKGVDVKKSDKISDLYDLINLGVISYAGDTFAVGDIFTTINLVNNGYMLFILATQGDVDKYKHRAFEDLRYYTVNMPKLIDMTKDIDQFGKPLKQSQC